MKILVLAAPDFRRFESLKACPPATLWPVGHQSLVAHWLDFAVRLGVRHVRLHSPDRPHLIREAIGDGAYWSIEFVVDARPAPAATIPMLQLPDDIVADPPEDAAAALDWWLSLNSSWLAQRDRTAVSLDVPRESHGWVGPQARIDPSARLQPPYWIGAGAEIGPDCVIGPDAFVGSGCLIDRGARVRRALLTAETYLGAHADLENKIAHGDRLFDCRSGTCVSIRDRFVLSRLSPAATAPSWLDRIAAMLPSWPARLSRRRSDTSSVPAPAGSPSRP